MVVAAVAAPTQVLSRVVVGSAIGTYPLPPYVVTVAPQIQWLRWVSAERIVIATNGQQRVGASLPAMDTNPRVLPGAPGTGFINWPGTTLAHGFVIAFNADGSHAGSLMTPAQAGGSVDVIGLDPAAPHWLVLSADGADRAVNVMTGATRRVGKPTVAAARQAEANRRAACATVEGPVLAKLTQALPGSHLAVVDSDATCNRLVAVPRGGDGAVYVYDRSAQRVLAFVGAHD